MDSIGHKLYQALGPFQKFGRTPIDPDLGINCGGETIDRNGKLVDWDGFCVEQWNKGWAVFANLLFWLVVVIGVTLLVSKILKRRKR